MDNVKRLVKHWFAWIRGSDEGSGTISGVALIAVAAIMLGAAASAGNLLLCLHRAQNAADLASVAAANALYSGSSDPCSVAERTISGNNATIGSCTIEGEDVLVEALPHGDFQNSVCLHDFLHRIKSRDTRLMAYDLMAGDTIDEIRTYRRWSRDHTYRTYNRLRLRMEEYLSI